MRETQLRRELTSQAEPLGRLRPGVCQRPRWTRRESALSTACQENSLVLRTVLSGSGGGESGHALLTFPKAGAASPETAVLFVTAGMGWWSPNHTCWDSTTGGETKRCTTPPESESFQPLLTPGKGLILPSSLSLNSHGLRIGNFFLKWDLALSNSCVQCLSAKG